jgi:hypothetical protein
VKGENMYSYKAEIVPVENGETLNGMILRGVGRLKIDDIIWVNFIELLEKADSPGEYIVIMPREAAPTDEKAEEAILKAVVAAYREIIKKYHM